MIPQELLILARDGWVPAPGESEEDFLIRIAQGKKTPLHFEPIFERESLLQQGSFITESIFGFGIDWVGVVFSNRKLSLFEGAAAWIFEEKEGGTKEAFLQLRKGLRGKKHLFGYYPLEELIAHELVHVARMSFEEPLFEEMLAYETSTSLFRKAFGPLFKKPKEMNFFIFTLILPLFAIFFPFLWMIPLLTLFFYLTRLMVHRRAYERKKQEIKEVIPEENRGIYLLMLTDKEILQKGLSSYTEETPREKLLKFLSSSLVY
jgi:hypothetical protein